MPRLMISISGMRGVYGDGLDDALAERFAYAFGTLYRGTTVVGRDSRKSGKAISKAVISGLTKAGNDVIDIGLASTPTTEMAVPKRNAAGGIIITASHNPGEWNGLKLLGPDGVFLDGGQGKEVLETFRATGGIGGKSPAGNVSTWDGANDHHVQSILDLDIIDGERIAAKRYEVCIDTVNGAGGIICRDLLGRLGCTIHALNAEPTGDFPHNPEPVPAHIGGLCVSVERTGADIGFAVDPDVDRLSLVSEKGTAIGEEYTLALAVDFMLGKRATDAACNLSTSRMVDDAAARHGRKVFRSPIGEINVVKLMRKVGAGIGGEGNGGIILPALHCGRDAVLGMAMILQFLTESGKGIGELASAYPVYHMIKDRIELGEKGAWIGPMKEAFAGETIDEQDGVKVIRENGWVHVRESNTEPIVRIFAEALTEDAARSLVKKVYDAIG